jgi:hypothetical protein
MNSNFHSFFLIKCYTIKKINIKKSKNELKKTYQTYCGALNIQMFHTPPLAHPRRGGGKCQL